MDLASVEVDGHFIWCSKISVESGDRSIDVEDFERFKLSIYKLLLWIMQYNWTGLGLINCISNTGNKKIVIIPDTWLKGNSYTNYRNNYIEIRFPIEHASEPLYTNSPSQKKYGAGFSPDETLLHELVHAYFMLVGITILTRKIKPFDIFDYENETEFVAILLTNIYASKKRGSPLRRDHSEGNLGLTYENSHKFLFVDDVSKQFGSRFPHLDLISNLIFFASDLMSYVRQEGGYFNPVSYFLNNKPYFEKELRELEERKERAKKPIDYIEGLGPVL